MSIKKDLTVRFLLIGVLLAFMVACDGKGNKNDNLANNDEAIPQAFLEELKLSSNEQLFSFKQSGDGSSNSAIFVDDADLAGQMGPTPPKTTAPGLFILDEEGQAKSYLKDAKFDRFFVVKNGKELAYIARIDKNDFERLKFPGGGWLILKNNQKPIALKKPPMFKYIADPSEFIGQTEQNEGLVFSYGNYVDLNGQDLSYGKNIDEVTAAQFVSGDFVALKRKISDKEVTTLVNVKTGFRRGYDSYFTPDFVQITDDGKGLMSDSSTYLSSISNTLISRLEDEFDQKYINKNKRGPVFTDAELNGCLWFNASVRLPHQNGALVTCYISAMANKGGVYKLVHLSEKPATASGAAWNAQQLFKMKSNSALAGIKASRPFVQGNGFTVAKNELNVLYINHGNLLLNKKIKIQMAMVFEIRTSNDLNQFYVVGEKSNGDQIMAIYDGLTGNLLSTKDVRIK